MTGGRLTPTADHHRPMTDHENELRETECGARFETASGEPVSPCYLPKGHIGDHRGTCLGSQCVWAHGVEREEEMTHVNNSHENELDRLRRQNATLRIRLQQRLCCEPDGAPDEVFRYCDQCKADINALSCNAGSDYISKESVKPLVEAAVANHKWHEDYDDCGGYPESDLCELNCKAIAVAKSLGIPTEKEGA